MASYTHTGDDVLRNDDDGRPATLSDVMEFDHVIRVSVDDGRTTVTDDIGSTYAPSAYVDTDGADVLDGSGWEWFTVGYSGQYGYSGPVMHASEMIGGRLADDILSTPGVYAAVVVESADETLGFEDHPAGWAIVKLREEVEDIAPAVRSFVELGDIMLSRRGEDACQEAYGTTDPRRVGELALQHGDIEGEAGR